MDRRGRQDKKELSYQGQLCVSATKVRKDLRLAKTPFTVKRVSGSASRRLFSATRSHIQKYARETRGVCSELGPTARCGRWFSLGELGVDVKKHGGDVNNLLHLWARDWGEALIDEGAEVLPIDLLSDTKQLETQHGHFHNYDWLGAAQKQQQVVVVVSGLSEIQQTRQISVFENIFRFARNGLVPIVFLCGKPRKFFFADAKPYDQGVKMGRYQAAVRARKARGAQRLPFYLQKEIRELLDS